MSHIQQTITLLEQELEVTQGRCHELTRAIETLRPLAGDVDAPAPRAGKTKTAKKGRRAAARSLPDDDKSDAILAALKKHGGVMKPGELASALKLPIANLRYRLKPMAKAKQVVITGTTMSRRVSLPGKQPAKEAP